MKLVRWATGFKLVVQNEAKTNESVWPRILLAPNVRPNEARLLGHIVGNDESGLLLDICGAAGDYAVRNVADGAIETASGQCPFSKNKEREGGLRASEREREI